MEIKNDSSFHEARWEARAVLRVNATLLFQEAPSMECRTIDIASRGIGLQVPEQVAPGTYCVVRFTAMIDGVATKIETAARVVYCTCIGTTGFRIGCRFVDLDSTTWTDIRKIVNRR